MTILRKRTALSAVLAGCLFIQQNCASMMFGTAQRVPVTSAPAGARVTVDSKYVGSTPITLQLRKKGNHDIKIEREGFAPVVISVRSRSNGMLILDGLLAFPIGPIIGVFLLGFPLAPRDSVGHKNPTFITACGVLGIGVGIAALATDAHNGAARDLSPEKVVVTMKKLGETSGPQLIVLSREQWSRVNWIRISCAK